MNLSDPQDVLARTIAGENDANGWIGMQAVANVVVNRANNPRWWGHDILSVCLAKEQFDCWLPGPDRDRIEALSVAELGDAWTVAGLAVAEKLPDVTENSDSYYSHPAQPNWPQDKFVKELAGLFLYRLEL